LGKKAFVSLGASFAYEYKKILQEFGVEVLHTVDYHYDLRLDNESEEAVVAATDVPTSINNVQQMETFLILKQNKPDFIILRAHGASPWAVRI